MRNVQNVLWTSGWDSTFRIVELMEKGAKIQPYYVYDKTRFSRKKELETILILNQEIEDRYSDRGGEILDLIVIKKKNIKFSLVKKLSYKRLKKRGHLGKQYYWLSCLASKIKNLELSVHSNDFAFLKGKTTIVEDKNIGKYAVLSSDVKDVFLKQIFGDMRFPLYRIKKLEMKELAEERGFIDIMNLTWFCHDSDEKPCGICNPCKQLVRDGMGYRLEE